MAVKPEWWSLWTQINGQLIKDRKSPTEKDLDMFRELRENHPTKDVETVLREAVDFLVGLKYDRGIKYKSARRFVANQFAKGFGGVRQSPGDLDGSLSPNRTAPRLDDYDQTAEGQAQYVADAEEWRDKHEAS